MEVQFLFRPSKCIYDVARPSFYCLVHLMDTYQVHFIFLLATLVNYRFVLAPDWRVSKLVT